MGNETAKKIVEALSFMPNELIIILLSMIPMIELRGSAPIAISLGMPWWEVIALSWLGSSLVCPIILLLLKPVLNLLKKNKFFAKIAYSVEDLFKSKAKKIENSKEVNNEEENKKVLNRELLSLFLFVSVPIPITGVWSGSAIAVFLNLPFFKSLLAIISGNLIAASLMTGLSYLLKERIDYLLWGLFIVVFILIIMLIVKQILKNKKNKEVDKNKN